MFKIAEAICFCFSLFSQSLDDAHKNYTQMKAKLLGAGTISNGRSFRAISDSLVTDISRCGV